MPRRKLSLNNSLLDVVQSTQSKTKNLFNTKVLVIALIIAAYFLGVLTTKVSYLEKNASGKGATSAAESQPSQNQPSAEQKPANQKPKDVSDSDHIRGNKNAKVTLIEYSDLECPFCQRFHPTMLEIMTEYGDKIRWIYRHFPLAFHANAQKEAEASECVAQLGGNDTFWNFLDKIFERTTANGTGFALDKLGPLAAELGVNQSQFQECLDSGKYEKFVKDQMDEGSKAGVF